MNPWTFVYTSPKHHYWLNTTTHRYTTTTDNKPPESGEGTYYNLLPLAVSKNESTETLNDIKYNKV